MKRTVVPELLDSDAGNAAEIAGSLADLRMINRWFGSASAFSKLMERVVKVSGKRQLSLLDVGAGSGDIANAARSELSCSGVEISVTLLDRSPLHMTNSSQATIAGDALALPFRDSSFDVVGCSTLAHHLEPNQLVEFANSALRVARVAFVINDLRRHPAHLALVYAGFPLFRSRLTRHDGPASVRRAYTPEEMRELLQQTSAKRVELSTHYLYRLGAIAWKEWRD